MPTYDLSDNPPYNLPSSEQLEHYIALRRQLQDRPDTVSDQDKKAFAHLVLGMSPDAIIDDMNLVEKLFPEEWRQYCENEWDTPEQVQALKDDELLAQGLVRTPDTGEMYFPFP